MIRFSIWTEVPRVKAHAFPIVVTGNHGNRITEQCNVEVLLDTPLKLAVLASYFRRAVTTIVSVLSSSSE